MQQLCRENKSVIQEELTATVFMIRQNSELFPQSTKSEPQSIVFRSSERPHASVDVIGSELELLELVRFTETFEELDTITVCGDLVKDPERFIKICSSIVGTNFLRITPEMNSLTNLGMFRSGFPIWLQHNYPHSLSKWIILFIERAIWVHYHAFV